MTTPDDQAPPPEAPPVPEAAPHEAPPDEEEAPLPALLRVPLYFAGWLFLLVGVVGLALPGIQGVLTLVLGASLLSVASEATHRWLRRLLRPFPKGAHHFERVRARVRKWLSRWAGPRRRP
jgi:hypothetical protein